MNKAICSLGHFKVLWFTSLSIWLPKFTISKAAQNEQLKYLLNKIRFVLLEERHIVEDTIRSMGKQKIKPLVNL